MLKLYYSTFNWPARTDPSHRTKPQFGSIHPARIGQFTTFLNMGSLSNVAKVDKSLGDTPWWVISNIVTMNCRGAA